MTASKTILLMDDDIAFSHETAEALRENGYDVDTATTASDAIELAQGRDYDLVITDMIVKSDGRIVPDGGLILIHALRSSTVAHAKARKTPVIGLSGAVGHRGMQNILRTAEGVGADMVLEKPFAPEDLLYAVEKLTANKG